TRPRPSNDALEGRSAAPEQGSSMQPATTGEPPSSPASPGVESRSLAEMAVRHLARLQRVTSALSEAVSLFDVCQVFQAELAEAVAARRAFVALAREA